MPNTREKLIELLAPTSLNFEKAVYLADHLIANGITIIDETDKPKIVKREFCHDSKMGWYMVLQQKWLGQDWVLCQQIPNEPSEYINAILKEAMKESEKNNGQIS